LRYVNDGNKDAMNQEEGRSHKRCLRRATPTHSDSGYNICCSRGDRIPWIAETSPQNTCRDGDLSRLDLENPQFCTISPEMNRVETRFIAFLSREIVQGDRCFHICLMFWLEEVFFFPTLHLLLSLVDAKLYKKRGRAYFGRTSI
jgi:hypothetical protein